MSKKIEEIPPEFKPYIEQSQKIMNMPEPQRTQYVLQTILSLVPAIQKIAKAPNVIQKKKLLDKLVNEWQQKSYIILPAIIYSIKPEFLPAYLEILTALSQLAPPSQKL